MMKRFISILLMVLLMFCCTSCNKNPVAAAETAEALKAAMVKQDHLMSSAHNMAQAARALGYAEDHHVIQLAKDEWHTANDLKAQYEQKYTELVGDFSEQAKEYPYATEVWKYLKNLGYSDYVCAGIMGNMMAECGGQSLALQPFIYSSTGNYYGLCQWSKKYYPQVIDASVEGQMNFLAQNIKAQMDTYGNNYKSGFNYDKFLQLNSTDETTKAFMKCYERASANTLAKRQANAKVAYNYFTK